MTELKRILSVHKRLAVFIALPILSLVLFLGSKNYADDDADNRQEQYVSGYNEYINNIMEQAERQTQSVIFSSNRNSFVFRNIIKTADDFAGMLDVVPVAGNNKAVESLISYKEADFIFLFVMLLVAMSFFDEKKNGLNAVVRSCEKGRMCLVSNRLIILFAFSVAYTFFLYFVPLAVSFVMHGGADGLTRPIQSLEAFRTCTYKLSIRGFLCSYFSLKILCGFLQGILFFILFTFIEHAQLVWIITSVIAAIEYVCYTYIPVQSFLSTIKYVNIFSYVHSIRLLTDYTNISLFGYPVEVNRLLLFILGPAVVLGSGAVLIIQYYRYPFGNRDVLGKYIHFFNRLFDFARSRMTITLFEGYKLIFISKVGLILLIAVMAGGKLRYDSGAYNDPDKYMYNLCLAEIQGEVTSETFDYMDTLRANIRKDVYYNPEYESTLDEVEQRVRYIADKAADGNYTPYIFDQTKLMNVFGEKSVNYHIINAFIVLVFIIMAVSPIWAFEVQNNTSCLLRSTQNGRAGLANAKAVVCYVVTVLIWAIFYLREFLNIRRQAGAEVMEACCRNFDVMADWPAWMTLGIALAYFYFIRLIIMLAVAEFVMLVSSLSSKVSITVIISSAVVLVTSLIGVILMRGINIFNPIIYMADINKYMRGDRLCIITVAVIIFVAVGQIAISLNTGKNRD